MVYGDDTTMPACYASSDEAARESHAPIQPMPGPRLVIGRTCKVVVVPESSRGRNHMPASGLRQGLCCAARHLGFALHAVAAI